jgi:hypothetical protein
MGGAVSNAALGLYYRQDPSGKKRKGPMVYFTQGRFQVLVPEGKLLKVVAECLDEGNAEAVLSRYKEVGS